MMIKRCFVNDHYTMAFKSIYVYIYIKNCFDYKIYQESISCFSRIVITKLSVYPECAYIQNTSFDNFLCTHLNYNQNRANGWTVQRVRFNNVLCFDLLMVKLFETFYQLYDWLINYFNVVFNLRISSSNNFIHLSWKQSHFIHRNWQF